MNNTPILRRFKGIVENRLLEHRRHYRKSNRESDDYFGEYGYEFFTVLVTEGLNLYRTHKARVEDAKAFHHEIQQIAEEGLTAFRQMTLNRKKDETSIVA